MKRFILLIMTVLTAVSIASAQKFTGKIGDFDVTMVANLRYPDEGDSIGYYYYNNRPNTKFKLVLEESANTDIALYRYIIKEYTPKGTHSGTFTGTFCTKWNENYYGKFTNSQGKEYEFEFIFEEELEESED